MTEAEIKQILNQATAEIGAVHNLKELENWRITYLGRKSNISLLGRRLKDLPVEERKKQGYLINQIRQSLEELWQFKKEELSQLSKSNWVFDYSLPAQRFSSGHLHPITLMIRRVVGAFEKLGFEIVEGPEIEDDYHHFEALNIPKDHPARDMWDTFWLDIKNPQAKNNSNQNLLLRAHTSPMQIRYMEKNQPPFKIIVPGRTFRHEATDATHEMQFTQIEGLMVSENISLANFKWIVEKALTTIFKKDLKFRFVPSYYPFVSPGLDVEINCFKCQGKGCSLCGGSGWLEIMGAGMVHQKVFEAVHYPKNQYQGFAFGIGVERLAMIQYNIEDIRLFNSSDLRFLKQF